MPTDLINGKPHPERMAAGVAVGATRVAAGSQIDVDTVRSRDVHRGGLEHAGKQRPR